MTKKIIKILAAMPDKGAVAGTYLRQRYLAEDDIGKMLNQIAAEELIHADTLLGFMKKLNGRKMARIPETFCAFSAMAPPPDIVSALYLDLFMEQMQRAALTELMIHIHDADMKAPIERILREDIRHTRRFAEALRLSLFRQGMCDPFEGAPAQDLNGRAEEIEYFLDPITGRCACRSAGKIAVHD